jgi:hypothetical protein
MAAAGQWGRGPLIPQEVMIKIHNLRHYTEAIGWKLEEIIINPDDVIDDDKLGLLKLTIAGDVVHEVGMKATEETFYVMREPKL